MKNKKQLRVLVEREVSRCFRCKLSDLDALGLSSDGLLAYTNIIYITGALDILQDEQRRQHMRAKKAGSK